MSIQEIVNRLEAAGVSRSADEVSAILKELDIAPENVTAEIVQAIAEDLARGSAIQKSAGGKTTKGKSKKMTKAQREQQRKDEARNAVHSLQSAIAPAVQASTQELDAIEDTVKTGINNWAESKAQSLVDTIRGASGLVVSKVAAAAAEEVDNADFFRSQITDIFGQLGIDCESGEAA